MLAAVVDLTLLATPHSGASAAMISCPGDCDRNGAVTVEELVHAVGVALTGTMLEACMSADSNLDGRVEIDDLVRAVAVALNGCPAMPALPRYPLPKYRTGSRPAAIAVADLNGDDRDDVMTANLLSEDVSVFLRNDDGLLQRGARFLAGDAPRTLEVASWDGGAPDVLVGGTNGISVLIGRGNGSLAPPFLIPTGSPVDGVHLLTPPTRATVLVVSEHTSRASIFFVGRGPDFAPPRQTASIPLCDRPVGLILAPLLTSSPANSILVPCAGSATLAVLTSVLASRAVELFPVGRGPSAVAAADLSGDGVTDVAVANTASDDVSILFGDGTARFVEQERIAVGEEPTHVVATDYDGDGWPDVLTANRGAGDISVLHNNEGDLTPLETLPVGIVPQLVAALPGAGNMPDLVVAGFEDDAVVQLDRSSGGSIRFPLPVSFGRLPDAIGVGDFNRDGIDDIATGDLGDNTISMRLGTPSGGLTERAVYRAGNGPRHLKVIDLNGDGAPDIVTVNVVSQGAVLLLNEGTGLFAREESFSVGGYPWGIDGADIDGDGNVDIAVAISTTDTRSAEVAFGDGRGRFQQLALETPGFPAACDVILGEVTGDGRVDVVLLYPGRIAIHASRGGRLFDDATILDAPGARCPAIGADLNEDGLTDLVYATHGTEIALRLARGDGTLAVAQLHPLDASPSWLTKDDLNQDGHIDIISSNGSSNDLTVLLGKGDGTFLAPRLWVAGTEVLSRPIEVAAGDFNGDGRRDLAAMDGPNDRVWLLLADSER